jgi:5-methyltetrahydrofolate--homocysteine methyltransferase
MRINDRVFFMGINDLSFCVGLMISQYRENIKWERNSGEDKLMLFNDRKYVFYDGAMGTMLQEFGLKEKPDLMNITAPEIVEKVHRMYVEAGSDILCTNTFGSNALNLSGTGYTPGEVISAAVAIAKRACEKAAPPVTAAPFAAAQPMVAVDIGPLGHLLEPVGDFEFERAYELFEEMAVAGEKAGADFVAIETMSDTEELRAAMTAVTDNTNLPILATMTFDKSGHTYMGCTPEHFVEVAVKLGAAAVGLNCSLEPSEMYETAKRIAKATDLPLIVKPNAGLPDAVSGEYHTGAQEFAAQMTQFAKIGAKIVGGCCGTTPEYIRELKKAFEKM